MYRVTVTGLDDYGRTLSRELDPTPTVSEAVRVLELEGWEITAVGVKLA